MKQTFPSPCVLWCWEFYAAVAGLPAAALSLWLHRQTRIPALLTAGFTAVWVGCFVLLTAVYLPLRRRRLVYCVDDTRLTAHGGVLFRSRQDMPLTAVRHITLLQGPPERLFGVATLWVAGTGGWILLEGLPLEQAQAVRRRLLGL